MYFQADLQQQQQQPPAARAPATVPACGTQFPGAMQALMLLLLLVMAVLSGGPARAAGAGQAPGSRIALVVGSEQAYPPFSTGMTDDTAGGFTVDLWKAVAEEVGLDYTLHVRPFRQILEEFKQGKTDVMINLAVSDERREFADFTVPHVIANGAVFVRKGPTKILVEDDLAGKSVIVVNADLAYDYAKSRGWGKQLIGVDTAAQGMRLLASGKYDAMLISKIAGLQTLQAEQLTNIEALRFKAGFSQPFAFAVRKGHSELLSRLNEALALTKSNGTYDALYLKWFGVYEVKELGLTDFLGYLVAAAAVLLAVAGFFFYRRQLERAKADNKYRDLYDQSPDMFMSVDQGTGAIIGCNQTLLTSTGYTRQQIMTRVALSLCHPDSVALARSSFRQFLSTREMPNVELQLQCSDGRIIDVSVSASAAFDAQVAIPDSRLILHLVLRDITDRKKAEEAQNIAATAFETHEAMVITDASKVILRVNTAYVAMTGYTEEDILGQTPKVMSSGRHDTDFFTAMWQSIRDTGSWRGEIWNRRKNGELYPAWMNISAVKGFHGKVTHYVSSQSDITLRKAAEEEISQLAFFDALTGLPNRRMLLDRLRLALGSSLRSGRDGALMFIDLDNFKTLNDTLGHHKGDLLLQQVAGRLVKSVREIDTVARLGGDEFVVMLEDLSDQPDVAAVQSEAIGEKILAALNLPYDLAGHWHRSTPSIGVTLFAHNKTNEAELLKRADLAMYQAKAAGRNTLRFFDPKIQDAVDARAMLETELRNAVGHEEFVLYFQAQVGDHRGSSTNEITGAEILVRWQHPERGVVGPHEFIPLAEETGLILPLGNWVLDSACRQLAIWSGQPDLARLTIAVNVSAFQFQRQDFVSQVLAILKRTGADPHLLKLEITESMLLADVEEIIWKMTQLQAHGIRFSLDDFGTGYSSLSYLKRLPLDQLKIDRSFVRDVLTDPNDAAIVRTILALGHSLGLTVIAEGVETQAQRKFLAGIECHEYQGYLFGKPVPLVEFEQLATRLREAA